MKDLHFVIPGPAVGKGRPKVASRGKFSHMYTPAKTVNYEGLVAMAGHQAMDGLPLIEGPVRLVATVFCSIPTSWSKKKRQHALEGSTYPTCKPDLDNIAKSLCDGLNGVVWVDDKQIVGIAMTKKYGDTPCVSVTVNSLAPVTVTKL